jgi:plastocyanin
MQRNRKRLRHGFSFTTTLVFVLSLSLASCGGTGEQQDPAGQNEPPQAAEPQEPGSQQMKTVETETKATQSITTATPKKTAEPTKKTDAEHGGGRISGTVQFVGTPPTPETLQATKDTEVCGKEKTSKALIVGANKGIENAVVFLTTVQNGKELKMPAENPVLDQQNCEYDPHVLLVPAGATIAIHNDDNILHNIHTHSTENPEFNRAQPKFKKVLRETFAKPEVVKVTCDVHNWMTAWIVVQGHPYYAKTDKNGAFTLSGVPAGDYELKVWHETLGEKARRVTVKQGEETQAAFELSKG